MKAFEYFVVQASGSFLTEYFPSEDMSDEEMHEFFIGRVCEQYEYNQPEHLVWQITELAYVLEGIYKTGYDDGVDSLNQ